MRGAALIVGTILIGIAGCGGGGGSSSSDYYKSIDKVGKDFATKLETLQNQFSSQTTAATEVPAAQQIQQLIEQTTRKVTALTPPAKVKALHAKLVLELHQFDAAVVNLETAVKGNDANRVSRAQDLYSNTGSKVPSTFLDISIAAPD